MKPKEVVVGDTILITGKDGDKLPYRLIIELKPNFFQLQENYGKMIKDRYIIDNQDVLLSDLFNDLINTDQTFIKIRFKLKNEINKDEFLEQLERELIQKFEENEDFTLDIQEDKEDSYILMMSKKIYE